MIISHLPITANKFNDINLQERKPSQTAENVSSLTYCKMILFYYCYYHESKLPSAGETQLSSSYRNDFWRMKETVKINGRDPWKSRKRKAEESAESIVGTSEGSRSVYDWKKTDKKGGRGFWGSVIHLVIRKVKQALLYNTQTVNQSCYHRDSKCRRTSQIIYLALGTQRMYMQPILLPRLDRVRNTSVVSRSLCEYWNSARSVRCSFHLPSTAPAPAPATPLPATDAPLRPRRLDVPVAPGAAGPASGSGRKAYVGSGGRKASLAAMRLGQGGQQNRQQSSLRERPFILHCAGGQEDHCADESTSSQC